MAFLLNLNRLLRCDPSGDTSLDELLLEAVAVEFVPYQCGPKLGHNELFLDEFSGGSVVFWTGWIGDWREVAVTENHLLHVTNFQSLGVLDGTKAALGQLGRPHLPLATAMADADYRRHRR
eukprot:CAMPEP_0172483980 /NCGR_PEP_ID=MMETSP1066-20121228/11229_1 /TAXON_ID=671091 /ORGANISM="Coscinodiscus wailesii, Strain CCMP2513" /LENGTH=120 /DNA_ID=CAMNT_0013248205 /DNA_START=134 /DNA_END=496 /DNA_ORIENTATION=+